LSPHYRHVSGADEGPLREGDIGEIVQTDDSEQPYLIKALNGSSAGSTFWYRTPAVVPIEDLGVGGKKMSVPFIQVSGAISVACNGGYRYDGMRNGRPCYTHTSGDGAIYYDGTYWKICQNGTGPRESGWNYSLRDDSREVPLGSWNRPGQHVSHESSIDYRRLNLTSNDDTSDSPPSSPLSSSPPRDFSELDDIMRLLQRNRF
jgi:hypothetical protein